MVGPFNMEVNELEIEIPEAVQRAIAYYKHATAAGQAPPPVMCAIIARWAILNLTVLQRAAAVGQGGQPCKT